MTARGSVGVPGGTDGVWSALVQTIPNANVHANVQLTAPPVVMMKNLGKISESNLKKNFFLLN